MMLFINILINGFVADGKPRMIQRDSSSYLLWRPADLKLVLDILNDGGVFQSGSLMSMAFPFFGPFLGFMAQVIAFIDRRCILLNFP